jgi:hypothetical protein
VIDLISSVVSDVALVFDASFAGVSLLKVDDNSRAKSTATANRHPATRMARLPIL